MSELFLTLVNMSITAGWLVLCVILLRSLLKKAPKWLRVALWGLVGVRLALPFSIESVLSLVPSAETISPDIIYADAPAIQSGIPALNSAVDPIIGGSLSPAVGASVNPLQIWVALASAVWLVGIAALLIYAAVSYLRLRDRIKTAIPLRENIYQSENVAAPFVLGFFRPRVYLPFGMSALAMENVIAHERAHIRRRDYIIKPIGYFLLCVYWFNPLLWLAYILLCRDIELACDERVIKELGHDERAAYSEALLSCSVPHRRISACPLAFGEVGVKERVKNVLRYKKPVLWVIVAAVAVCVVAAVCFLTNPQSPPVSFDNMQLTWAKALDLRPNEPASRDLNKAQLAELKSQLLNLKVGRKDSDFGGLTAMYSLTIQAQRTPLFAIICYDVDGNKLALYYEDEYYRLDNAEFARYLSAACAGEDAASAGAQTLSLNDVIMLSQKGEELTWADLDGYAYIETGSGLYIRVYEINEQFSLWIGGGSTDGSPMYIRLVSKADQEDHIDIRRESVTDFINANRLNALPVTFGSADLDRDGKAERFAISQTDPIGIYTLKVVKDDGDVLWSEEAGTAHVGWNSLFLYNGPDGAYLLRYDPTMYQGEADYHYELFTLEGGSETITASGSVAFSVNPGEFPTSAKRAEMDRFAETVNALLESSVLLLSTQEGSFVVGPSSAEPFMERYAVLDDEEAASADALDAILSAAILEHNSGKYRAGDFACESHILLASETGGPAGDPGSENNIDTAVFYLMVAYREYTYENGEPEVVSGGLIPTALTFGVSGDGKYTLKEYWEPRDGSFNPGDIREKFPGSAAEDATTDAQRYANELQQACDEKAAAYYLAFLRDIRSDTSQRDAGA